MQYSNEISPAPNGISERILDTLNSSIMCLDAKRQITYINSAGEALFESSASSLVGRHFASLLSELEPSSILDKLRLDSIGFTEHEAVITLANGKSITANYSIYRFDNHSDDGGIVLEIRQLERQAQFAQDELKQQQQLATQQLARGLAHEINNPLGGIRGAAQLLQRALDRPEWTEYTEIIISEVDRLQSLTSNMLGPGNRMQPDQVNILEVLEHIRRIILAAEPERISIHRDYDPSIPELTADRDILIQAFLNIVRNAVQAIDGEGQITFKTRVEFRYTIGQITHPLVLRVDISDTGHGIPKELGETIFLPMITDKADGSGLGLPIAQEIISRHGGTIHLQSSTTGTTFSTFLPLGTHEETIMNMPAQNLQIPIWIIDDDQSMRWVLDKTLSNNGYRVNAFESGSVALAHFKRTAPEERPSLIITDVRMPGINGFELLKQIKHISPQTPIIVMTAYTDLDTTVQAFHEGAFEYLPKPFDIDDALELVARACEPVADSSAGSQRQPPELSDWQAPLRLWAKRQLAEGETEILKTAAKTFEKTLLDCALEATHGRKQDAARLLGWGRNTLTRKLKELD